MAEKNLFAGIEEVDRDEPNGGGNYLSKDGDYVLEIEKFQARESKNPNSEGQTIVILEGTVIEVTRNVEGVSHKVGERLAVIEKPERTFTGKLTTKGAYAMGRIKSMAAAILGENGEPAPDSAITAEALGALAGGDGETLKGTRVCCSVTSRAREGKAPWISKTWAPLA